MSDKQFLELEANPAAVERAIRRLPVLEREALLMKARDRMTYASIGAALGVSAAEAEAKVAAALATLHARTIRRRQFRSQLWLCFRWPARLLRGGARRLPGQREQN